MRDQPVRHVILTIEAAIPIDKDLGQSIQACLDDVRGQSAARVVDTKILGNQAEYDAWYSSPDRKQEIEVPTIYIQQISETVTIGWD